MTDIYGSTIPDGPIDIKLEYVTCDEEAKVFLIAFQSGHYKRVAGSWTGDSVWGHFKKEDGDMIHINRDKVEYIEELG